jgi:hypothetical protein
VAEQAMVEADGAGKQSMVLVGNVELVEYPEQVPLSTLVRFGIADFLFSSFERGPLSVERLWLHSLWVGQRSEMRC